MEGCCAMNGIARTDAIINGIMCPTPREGSKSLTKGIQMKLSHDFSGALRTFAYFMASGTHDMLEDVEYLDLYGNDPSAIEMAFAIFANVIELGPAGEVLNFEYAQERATDYIRSYCDPDFEVSPSYEEWETALYSMPTT